eukprot:TRINITY_DN40971_c0_g1_i2.p2 TRINITY_DN40971_c0_g1~~TRINITY_DN40971_c0_g1_i2.p2  ORF type:complete len:178 (+),score=47.26 TRINITY_DN40971_c0_g1_i2:60-593(+)
MGNAFSSVFSALWGAQEKKILMVGLDAAGKTTILYKLNLDEVVHTNPTVGFNLETVKHKNITFTVWDVGGQSKIRNLWKHYYQHAQGLIFVVDATDRDRIEEARQELLGMLQDAELEQTVLLVLGNKQDMPTAMRKDELAEQLQLPTLKQRYLVVEVCALDGQGLMEGLDWLARTVS